MALNLTKSTDFDFVIAHPKDPEVVVRCRDLTSEEEFSIVEKHTPSSSPSLMAFGSSQNSSPKTTTIFQERFKACVVGWEGLERDGKPLECTEANKAWLANNFIEFAAWVLERVKEEKIKRIF